MDKKQTALMDLIVRLRLMMEDLPSGSNRALGLATAMDLASYLKQIEREQIEEAYKEGAKKRFNTMLIKRDEINKSASDYFTQKYGHGKD